MEAVYAKKPVVIWEYPVYSTDVKPLGFKVISLGDVEEVIKMGFIDYGVFARSDEVDLGVGV